MGPPQKSRGLWPSLAGPPAIFRADVHVFTYVPAWQAGDVVAAIRNHRVFKSTVVEQRRCSALTPGQRGYDQQNSRELHGVKQASHTAGLNTFRAYCPKYLSVSPMTQDKTRLPEKGSFPVSLA